MRTGTPTSLARGLGVLAVVVERGEVRADVLARDVGLPLSTVYRYLRDLRAAGFVCENEAVYQRGARLIGSVGALPTSTELQRVARPTLERLSTETDETVLLLVRNGVHAMCLDQVESKHAIHLAFRIGQKLPLHAGATSRVLLAFAPADILSEVVEHLQLFTPATPDASNLLQRLEAILRTGYATSRGEFVTGAVAIACPIIRDDVCICSIGIAAPARRANPEWQRRAKDSLAAARRDLESLV